MTADPQRSTGCEIIAESDPPVTDCSCGVWPDNRTKTAPYHSQGEVPDLSGNVPISINAQQRPTAPSIY